jgi:hemerythrin
MSSFTWLDAYKIGNQTIDQQHEYLFDLANQIVDPENDPQKTHLNVMALYHYVGEHFKDEEALMKKYDYPKFAEHHAQHAVLTQQLTEISSGIINGDISPQAVMHLMNTWLLDHILRKDLLLADFLHQKTDTNLS